MLLSFIHRGAFVRTLTGAALLAAAFPVRAEEGWAVSGVVTDPAGAVVPGVALSLLGPQGFVLRSGRSDSEGRFSLAGIRCGSYLLQVEREGFAPGRAVVTVGSSDVSGLAVTLGFGAFKDEATVTASPGRVEAVEATSHRVNAISEEEIALRAKAVVAQIANEEVGLHLQRTSPTIAGIYVRGLTGSKVNVYADGVRYTTSAQRGGISTFLDLVGPESLQAVEVLRGPSSAEYGSDALGGSIQLLTRAPTFAAGGSRLQGSFAAFFDSADTGYGASVNASYARRGFGLSGTLAGRRDNTLRAAGGVDSHNAITRFFGLSSALAIGDLYPDTAFTQYGGRLRANWAVTPTSQLTASYLRSQQDGGKRYDQLLGGDGNLVADLRNLMLDCFYARWEKVGAGWFDRVALTYSLNIQREERVNQGGNGNPAASINHEPERLVVNGFQANALNSWGRHSVTGGGDFYAESMQAPSFGVNPSTGAVATRRGRVPDGARYTWGGVFAQDVWEAVPGRLRVDGSLRWSAFDYAAQAADAPLGSDGKPLWPDDSYRRNQVTFRAGALYTVGSGFSVAASVSQGFRAPNITDLGTFGLTGSGYEVSNREVAGLGATVGTSAGTNAVSSGEAVGVLEPETSLGSELTLRYRASRFETALTGFVTDLHDNIAKQALILGPGAEGTSLAGEPIVRRLASGVVFVGASSSPVLVRANFDQARIWGIEYTANWRASPSWSVSAIFTYLHAEDRSTGLPPNIEGGTPAPDGWLQVRFAPRGGKRFWIQAYLHAAARQDRLSSLDLEDRRTGAPRSRSSIASFFNNGARARGLLGNGADGRANTADDVLLASGETLAQVQDRVLGPGGASSFLFTAVPGYGTFGVRGALRFGARHEILVDLENAGDRSYRGVSWGLDGPARGVFVRYSAWF